MHCKAWSRHIRGGYTTLRDLAKDREDQRGLPRPRASSDIAFSALVETILSGKQPLQVSIESDHALLSRLAGAGKRPALGAVVDTAAALALIFYVADVDALYDGALAAGCQPATVPHDAVWGERFFHLIDPDGHELSFARPMLPVSVQ